MTRTLWVTNDLPPRAGGIEQYLANVLARLDPGATRVLAPRAAGDAAHDATVAYRVDRVGGRPLLPRRGLLDVVRAAADEHGAEVVVFGAAWPLASLATGLDLPTLALTHGHEAGMARVGLGSRVRHSLRGVDAVGVISAYTRAVLDPWLPATAAVHWLPPGVDVDVFHPDVDGATVRARLGVGATQPLVMCVARLVARKGQDALVRAWPAVARRVPGARLALAGTGPMRGRLEARARTLRVAGAVTFAGPVAGTDLPAFHTAADVFAMPCRTRLGGLDAEGLGIVYLEAQACGRPVVAGRSGGAPEAVLEGESGLVVDGRSTGRVAAAVADLLEDPSRRRRMGAAGRAFVAGRFAWPVISDRFRRVLMRLAGADP
ncbi:MAG: glycosyltransferase family 4 protein [Actinobacteria bacterium]|nr:glycosyltransferase family 4 protein [Actinomycetota bacterium]